MNNKHPKGLPYLFFTEMWERFGYYLILGIFVLYLIEPEGMRGGLGLPDKMAKHMPPYQQSLPGPFSQQKTYWQQPKHS
jgi:hypothetical protein